MRATLRDIAQKLGVSVSTVSLALRNSSKIPPARRREIQRVARQLHYVPDPFLSGLVAHRRGVVSVKDHGTLAWVDHWKQPGQLLGFKEFAGYWRGASGAASRFGYRLDEIRWPGDCSPKRFERILLARGIQGVLIPPHNEPLDWGDFDWSEFSVMRFGLSVRNLEANSVTADVFRAVVMAVQKMHEYGYRRIGFTVHEEFNRRLRGNHLSGFFWAQDWLRLRPAVPPLLTTLSTRDRNDLAAQREQLSGWLERHRPDAILTADIEIPGMVRELGYRVPEDVALAGTSVLDIPVDAGVDQQSETVGRIAVEMLVKQININERGVPENPCRILVESRWQDGRTLPRRN